MNELSSAIIASHLQQGQVLIFDEIDSTNDYLLRHAKQLACGSICIANTQTAGRGRRGRNWYSPKGQNLYFSLLWHYKRSDFAENTPLAPLSLLVSLKQNQYGECNHCAAI